MCLSTCAVLQVCVIYECVEPDSEPGLREGREGRVLKGWVGSAIGVRVLCASGRVLGHSGVSLGS